VNARCPAPHVGRRWELGPRKSKHEDRVTPRPLEQVLDEVEQAFVSPLEILEDEDDGVRVRHALEEEPPCREELLALALLRRPPAEELHQPRLEEGAFFCIEEVLDERGAKLFHPSALTLVLRDAAAHSHHVGERPVRHALAVREAAAAMPPDRLGDSVEVLVELPRQARLADAGDPGRGDEVRLPVVRGGVEELLHEPELPVAPHERRLEPGRFELTTRTCDDPERTPELHRFRLSFQLVRARVLECDRLLRRASRRLADEQRPGLRHGLDAGRGVDQVAGDHAL
jgi:hypothetical protein